MTSTQRLPQIEEIVKKVGDRWTDCGSLPESTLLRMALLREFLQNLHSEKSRCLAAGHKEEVQAIKELEIRLEGLKDGANLNYELEELVEKTPTIPRKNRILPESLFSHMEREKLLRYDRKWEAAITAEAHSLTWKLWTLQCWVNISEIEEWDRLFSQKLWPHGLVLFTESAPTMEKEKAQESLQPGLWKGCWTTVIHPKFKNPLDLALDLRLWRGSPTQPPSEPQWKRIST